MFYPNHILTDLHKELGIEKNEFKKIKNCNYSDNIKSNCNGADLVVLLTEWDEFKSIDFKKIVKKSKFKVYDLRNLYSAEGAQSSL